MNLENLRKTETTNTYGKVKASTVKKVDTAIADLLNQDEKDIADVKKVVSEVGNFYANKKDLASLEYLYMKIDDVISHLSSTAQKTEYTIQGDPKKMKDIFSGIISSLKDKDVVISGQARAHVLEGYKLCKEFKASIYDLEKAKGKNSMINLPVNVVQMGYLQKLLPVNYSGGIDTAKRIQEFNDMLTITALEMNQDFTIINNLELANEDVSKGMAALSESMKAEKVELEEA